MVRVNKKIAFISVLMAILILGVTFKWVYEPRVQEIKNLVNLLNEEYEKNKIFFEINKTKGEIESRVAKELLKTEKDLTWLLGKVSDAFKFLNLEVISLEPQSLERTFYYTRMPVKIKTVCSYHRLGELISRLESLDKFVDVKMMEIKLLEEKSREKKGTKSALDRRVDDKGFALLEVTLIINSLYPNQ